MPQLYCETIVAMATPAGRGGVGIIRISGPQSRRIAEHILGFMPRVRYAHHAKFYTKAQDIVDEGIALFFEAPHSFTGEDVVELHGHGGPVVMDCLLRCVVEHGARLARPGEFSEQAFLNQKMDLTQAEAIADLINAASEQAARAAVRSLQGEFSAHVQQIVTQLIQLRRYVEAAIDFPDEEIDFLKDSHVLHDAKKIQQDIGQLLGKAQQGFRLREGATVVIVGAPNVGKSSLLNFLSGRDSAIVTDIPGTTRDILREEIIIDGLPLHIMDTAGLRETEDIVEREGIRRARAAVDTADLIIYVLDVAQATHLEAALTPLAQNIPMHIPRLIVVNKIDLLPEPALLQQKVEKNALCVSIKNNIGMDIFLEQLKQKVGHPSHAEGNFLARRRHLVALTHAQTHLAQGMQQLEHYQAGELLAEELRLAQEALSRITGTFTADDLLGEIFSSFCVGK